MKSLTIENIPEDIYNTISRLAKKNRRTIQQEILCLLERARALDPPASHLARARQIRQRLQGRDLGNTVKEIREERAR